LKCLEWEKSLSGKYSIIIQKQRRKYILDKFEKIDKAREILGLGEKANKEEIKNSYRELMKKYHLDKTPENWKYPEKVKQIN